MISQQLKYDERSFADVFEKLNEGITKKDTENIAELIRKRRVLNIINQTDVYGRPFPQNKTPNKSGKRLINEQYLMNDILKTSIPNGFEVFVGDVLDRDEIAIYLNFGTKNIQATPFFMGFGEELGDVTEEEINAYLDIKMREIIA